MVKRLLKPTDKLKIGTILMFRHRFRTEEYSIVKVVEVYEEQGEITSFDVVTIQNGPNAFYRINYRFSCSFKAHTEQKESIELTYILPVYNLLHGTK